MNNYELMLVIKPDQAEEAEEKLNTLTDSAAEKEQWGKRPLAYEIDNYKEADYRVWQLEMEPGKVKDLEKKISQQDYLLRYLLVRKE